ncbi:YHS domain-containing protein [Allonocardiopsis opalescens]|uniref:YHS domain-containing protein n=1 Tax=Allonocardiopsis opalescens TaxID=1144618 RepID=A0A2T0QDI1_9ACTN|nr:YHS domain-containing protein [Allonocardiopsis opalescens]PRY01930.1 YHS domain-containing protein [Allonocardiopsis opalescens]
MILIEIAHPAGALREEDRRLVAERLVGAFLTGDSGPGSAPEATLRRAATMTHVAFRELYGWHRGDGPPDPGAAPPVIASVTVPEAWREDVAPYAIGVLRSAVRQVDTARAWERRGGDLWVTVRGVPDGSIGLDGRPATADGVLAHMTEEFRAAQAAGTAPPPPDGTLLDPVCGMYVRPGKGSITLDHDGETVGFCSRGCRDSYAREHGLAPA